VIFFLFCGSCSGIVVGSLYQPKNCTCKCLFLDVRVCLDVVNIQAKCTIFYACLTFFCFADFPLVVVVLALVDGPNTIHKMCIFCRCKKF
jgi:hypothetical protein